MVPLHCISRNSRAARGMKIERSLLNEARDQLLWLSPTVPVNTAQRSPIETQLSQKFFRKMLANIQIIKKYVCKLKKPHLDGATLVLARSPAVRFLKPYRLSIGQ